MAYFFKNTKKMNKMEIGAPDIVAWASLHKTSRGPFELAMCLEDIEGFVDAPRCNAPPSC